MPKKAKNQECTGKLCRNHLFELCPLSKGLFFKKIQKMRLCPHFDNNLNKFSKSIPVLNRDNKFYTPNFILESQQKFYQENSQRFLIKHIEKIQESQSEKSQIVNIHQKFLLEFTFSIIFITQLVPKHSTNRNYCSVCFKQFDDYLEHTIDQKHKKNMKKNKYTVFVKELATKYTKVDQKLGFNEFQQQFQYLDYTHQNNTQTQGMLGKAQFYDKSALQSPMV